MQLADKTKTFANRNKSDMKIMFWLVRVCERSFYETVQLVDVTKYFKLVYYMLLKVMRYLNYCTTFELINYVDRYRYHIHKLTVCKPIFCKKCEAGIQ